MKKCNKCLEVFKWDDVIVNSDDLYFHKECVELYPSSYVVFVDDEFVGEVEYEDDAYFILNKGEYLEESE